MPESDRGEKVGILNAVPTKEILRNKAGVCPPLSAICEIMDNIFDNFEENKASHDLSISFVIRTTGDTPEISIAENSGGVNKTKLEPLVRLGLPYHGAKGSIGTWGEGFKVAAFSLGSEVEILTHFPGETPVSVHFQNGWLDSPDWGVPYYAIRATPPARGSTVVRIRHLERALDWAEIMRELAVIYGHKIQAYEDLGRKVRVDFDVDGNSARVKPRPLASLAALQQRLAFPPDFSPRVFIADWATQHGAVRCRIIVGLTARHSGETSGVYLYGNGRMFARALRTRVVGYGESGNSILRDHPSCWRIHAYAFLEAEDGADIPWQAPLKDGVSENHPIAGQFRDLFKEVVAPYSRFAKIAKASELVPYTADWAGMSDAQKAEALFGKQTDSIERFKRLPKSIREFTSPSELESLRVDGVTCQKVLSQLEEHAKYVRQVITARDLEGPGLEEYVLKALNPAAFPPEGAPGRRGAVLKVREPSRSSYKSRVSIELRGTQLRKLRVLFDVEDDRRAIHAAVKFALRHSRAAKRWRNRRGAE